MRFRETSARAALGLALAGTLLAACTAVTPAPAPTAAPAPTGAPTAGHSHATPAPAGGEAPLLAGIGDHSHPISTSDPRAQQYFDQGLTLAYAFNHEEAVRSFRAAIALDPSCAICHWGVAYALGPNINAPMFPEAIEPAWEAVQRAQELAPQASPAEQAYIAAIATRYSPDPAADRAALDLAFAEAMRELYRQFPDDTDAGAIFAEALMNLTPWNYYDPRTGEATEHTAEIEATLERVLDQDPAHPGANHFYIHAVEASFTPERALPSARVLEGLVPAGGHLVHMPAHIYWRTGLYADGYRVNIDAVRADEQTVGGTPDQNAHTFYSLAYYPHNIHFLVATAQMMGQRAVSMEHARELVAAIPPSGYEANPGLEDFRPLPLFIMVRFGMWQEILAEPQPEANFQYATAIWHWARGLAFARTGALDEAGAEYAALADAAADPAMEELVLYSFASGKTMLDIASHMLAGELALARGDQAAGIAELRQAVEIQDNLHYIEPPAWHFPVRHYLGAALLDAGQAGEAETVYNQDLRQYPQNGWSYFGLEQALRAQGKNQPADELRKLFERAWENADVELSSSRF